MTVTVYEGLARKWHEWEDKHHIGWLRDAAHNWFPRETFDATYGTQGERWAFVTCLKEVRDHALYRKIGFESWDQYCETELGYPAECFDAWIKAAEMFTEGGDRKMWRAAQEREERRRAEKYRREQEERARIAAASQALVKEREKQLRQQLRAERLQKPKPSPRNAELQLFIADTELRDIAKCKTRAEIDAQLVKVQQHIRRAAEYCGANLAKAYPSDSGTGDEWPLYEPIPKPDEAEAA